MLTDGLTLIEGSTFQNLTLAQGTTFPLNPSTGELFFRTDAGLGLHVYSGAAWLRQPDSVYVDAAIAGVAGGLDFKGTWNPVTNTPALVSSVGVKGEYYKVSTAGLLPGTTTVRSPTESNSGLTILISSTGITVGQSVTGGNIIGTATVTIVSGTSLTIDQATFTNPTQTFTFFSSLNGLVSFNVGDLVLFNGTAWDGIDGSQSEVSSVAGRMGAIVLTVADVSGVAALASPAFTGTPTAPTAAPATDSTQLATTAFVKAQGYVTTAGSVTSVAGKTGAVVLVAADVGGVATSGANSNITSLTGLTTALSVLQGGTGTTTSTGTGSGVHAVSPALTGTPTAPTAATADSSTALATTAFVKAQGYGVGGTVAGADTQIQYNNAGAFGASSNFTYAASSALTLTNPTVAADKITITPTSITISTATASFRSDQQRDLTVNAGDVSTANAAGLLTVRGADSAQQRAGSVIVRGGNNNTGAAGGGDITLAGGAGGSGIPGFVYMKTANTERFRIDNVGTITATTNNLLISSPAGSFRTLYWTSGASGRWNMHADNTAESGSDGGSNFNMVAQGDTGTQTIVYSINRASKILDFKISPTSVTPATADSSTKLATTAFVKAQGYVSSTGATLTGATLTGNTSVQAMLEKVNTTATAPTATTQIDLNTAAVWNFTVAATANFTLNIRGSSTATLNNTMAIGQSASIAVLVTNGATAFYPTVFTIDGTVVTPKWNGTAPTAGSVNAIDSYSLTVIKTAASTYTVLATATKFA